MFELLNKLTFDITFRPEDGKFRSKLASIFINNADYESAAIFSERNSEIHISVSSETFNEGIIKFIVVSDFGEEPMECHLAKLTHDEINDFHDQLSQKIVPQTPRLPKGLSKIIIRKNISGMLNVHQASQYLGCTPTFLKINIPCTDYTYQEVDGKKEIKEYYWSQNLIERLCQIMKSRPKGDDVKFIATECCDGDYKWAEEILNILGCPLLEPNKISTSHKGITNRSPKIISKELTNHHPSSKGKK